MMISKPVFILVMVLVPVVAIAQQIENLDLDKYQGENRLLLIFAPTTYMNAYQVQQSELESVQAGIEERDLKVFYLLQVGNAHVDNANIARSQVEELARKYKVNPRAFTLILIGKDGAVKLRQNMPIKLTELFSVIDAMRQREIPQRN